MTGNTVNATEAILEKTVGEIAAELTLARDLARQVLDESKTGISLCTPRSEALRRCCSVLCERVDGLSEREMGKVAVVFEDLPIATLRWAEGIAKGLGALKELTAFGTSMQGMGLTGAYRIISQAGPSGDIGKIVVGLLEKFAIRN